MDPASKAGLEPHHACQIGRQPDTCGGLPRSLAQPAMKGMMAQGAEKLRTQKPPETGSLRAPPDQFAVPSTSRQTRATIGRTDPWHLLVSSPPARNVRTIAIPAASGPRSAQKRAGYREA